MGPFLFTVGTCRYIGEHMHEQQYFLSTPQTSFSLTPKSLPQQGRILHGFVHQI